MPESHRRFSGEPPPSVTYLLDDLALMAAARNYLAWQYRMAAPHLGRRVVEVGCGNGNFTGLLLQRGSVIAADTERECVERTRARYPGEANLIVKCCGPPDAAFLSLRNFEPDSCVCLNVIEHIADDVAALAAIAAILPAAAKIVALVPACEALYGPIDFRLGHYRRYTRHTLARAALSAGLEVESARYMNLPGFFGWLLNARFFRRGAQSAGQIALFDRAVVPVISRLESIVPPPFGQSIFAVLQKK